MAAFTFFFFKTPKSARPVEASLKEKILQLDLIGAGLMMSLLISYILALQYAGQTHAWNSSEVIGLLVGFVLLLGVFIVWQIYQKEYAMIVPRLVSCSSPPPAYFSTLQILTVTTVHETIYVDRLLLHDLLFRLLFRYPLLPPNILPKRSRRRPHRFWCPYAGFDRASHFRCHRARLPVHEDWYYTTILDRWRNTRCSRLWSPVHHGRNDFCRQMDRIPDHRGLCCRLDDAGCLAERSGSGSSRGYVSGLSRYQL